jgi:hypothetical protein
MCLNCQLVDVRDTSEYWEERCNLSQSSAFRNDRLSRQEVLDWRKSDLAKIPLSPSRINYSTYSVSSAVEDGIVQNMCSCQRPPFHRETPKYDQPQRRKLILKERVTSLCKNQIMPPSVYLWHVTRDLYTEKPWPHFAAWLQSGV